MNTLRLSLLPVLFLFAFISLTGCIKEDILQADMPDEVVSTWRASFPGATSPDWRSSGHEYEVEFAWQNQLWWAEINCDGILLDQRLLGELEETGRSTTSSDNPTRQPQRSE